MKTKSFLLALLALGVFLTGGVADPPPPVHAVPAAPAAVTDDFVELTSIIPNLIVELPYATERNAFKRRFYKSNRSYLHRAVAEKLALVQKDLNVRGLGLKIWDAYRPLSVQWEFWKAVPDARYVADPRVGSRHNRGAAVDVTLVDLKTGQELPMPTKFDDFSPKAAPDYPAAPPEALKNRALLREAMKKHGFTVLPTEWWHFDSDGWEKYPVADFDPDSHAVEGPKR